MDDGGAPPGRGAGQARPAWRAWPPRWWGRLEPVEWAYLAGLVLLVILGVTFAVRYVQNAEAPPLPPVAESVRTGPSVSGWLVSADDDRVVIRLSDGQLRRFAVRPQDRERAGIRHLKADEGARDVGFIVYYETVGGRDYIVGAAQTAPPLGG